MAIAELTTRRHLPTFITMIRKALISFIISAALLLSSCSGTERNFTVYSDKAAVAELVNLFNQTQSDFQATFVYSESAPPEERNPGNYDVVIANGLHSEEYKTYFTSLNSLRSEKYVREMYPELMQAAILDTTLTLIPLSLSLPVVVSKEEIDTGKYISWDEMSDLAGEFNREKEDSLTNTGFSPLWSDSFITAYYNSRTLSYPREVEEKEFSGFTEISEGIKNWVIETNGSLERSLAFSTKYRYIPDYRLIENGRIAFTVMPLEEWALLPDVITRELHARLLNFEKGLETTRILSAAVPKSAGNQEGGLYFMKWILQDSTWDSYLTLISRNRDEIFGFLGGISASADLNYEYLVKYYPWMKPHVPRRGEFAPLTEIGAQWPLAWDRLFLPYILEILRNPNTTRDFSRDYRNWQLLHPDPWKM
ncbi:MAG: hypothetical protein PQJ50_16340 [Spirochaetales bacterium]|nr:hypothetical protein [Spirochaetales bacterium]